VWFAARHEEYSIPVYNIYQSEGGYYSPTFD